MLTSPQSRKCHFVYILWAPELFELPFWALLTFRLNISTGNIFERFIQLNVNTLFGIGLVSYVKFSSKLDGIPPSVCLFYESALGCCYNFIAMDSEIISV